MASPKPRRRRAWDGATATDAAVVAMPTPNEPVPMRTSVRGDADRSIALPNSRLKAAKTSERSVAQYGTIECESIGACSSTGAMKPLAPYTNMP